MSTGHAGQRALRQLLDAVLVVGAELDLRSVLLRIVESARELVDARYGALGVLDESGTRLAEFITVGVDDEQRARIGHPPKGLGILGTLITDATPLRITELTDDPRSVGFPPNHPPMLSFLGVPIRVRGEVFGNLYLTDKIGADAFTDVDQELVEGLAAAAGIAIENARLFERSRRRETALAAMQAIATSLLEGARGHDTLQDIARHARELVDADACVVALPQPTGDLGTVVTDGELAQGLAGWVFPAEGSVSGEVLATGRTVLIPDASADPRTCQPIVGLGGFGPAVFAPLTSEGRPYGTLLVARRQGQPQFTDTELELVQGFAAQASVVLDHERILDELQRAALVEDQERIARDLHDSVIQRVFAAGLSLQAASAMVDDERARARIDDAVDELDAAMRQIRTVIFDLGNRRNQQQERLRGQVLAVTREASRALGFSPDVAFAGAVDTRAGEAVTAELVATLREALSNVARHAAAKSVSVDVHIDGPDVVLRVVDDGCGIGDRASGGHGLTNMHERATRLGGRCEIGPGPGGGTVVDWRVPLGD